MRVPRMLFTILLALVVLAPFQNCGVIGKLPSHDSESLSSYSAAPKFSEIYAQVITPKCLTCHSDGNHNFSTYNALMATGDVIPGSPTTSPLYLELTAGRMPMGGARLNEIDLAAIYEWILTGASEGTTVPTIPGAPTGLTAAAVGTSMIALNWVLPPGVLTGVKVERGEAQTGPFVVIVTLGGQDVMFTDTGLSATSTHYYRISTTNAFGSSPYSSVVSATTAGVPVATAPAAPSGLTATATSQTQITVSWTDNSSNETSFEVERSTNSGGPFDPAGTSAANVPLYMDTGLAAGTTYYYRARAVNAVGNSAYTAVASAATFAPPVSIPATPSGLIATANSQTQITLNWTDNSSDETGFQVERATSAGGNYSQIASPAANATSYVNTGLTAGTTYYYRVRSVNSAGSSPSSSVVNATTQAPAALAPEAPTTLTAVATTTAVTLLWNDTSNNETGFEVQRGTAANGPFSLITTTAAGVATYMNTGLTSETTYYYRVRAVNGTGNSAYTSIVSATTSAAAVPAPAAPSALAATASSSSVINLSWMDNSNNENAFTVERGASASGPFTVIHTAVAGATSYSNTGLTAATTYYYRVRAGNTGGYSAYTSVVNATTQAAPVPAPAAPSTLTGTATSSSGITLNWTDNSNNETGFEIERGASVSGPFTLINTAAAGVSSYSNTGLTAATTYYYRVRAVNSGGSSAYTALAIVTTQAAAIPAPTAPSGLTATAISSSTIALAWTDNSNNETSFEIERGASATGPFTLLATAAASTNSYHNSSLTAATAYYYRVRAVNSGGNSAYTSVANATTQAAVNASATFTWMKANIFDPKCISCHGASRAGGYDFRTYSGVRSGLSPGNANGSRVYTEINSGSMPKGGAKLPAASITNLRDWINAGALDN